MKASPIGLLSPRVQGRKVRIVVETPKATRNKLKGKTFRLLGRFGPKRAEVLLSNGLRAAKKTASQR